MFYLYYREDWSIYITVTDKHKLRKDLGHVIVAELSNTLFINSRRIFHKPEQPMINIVHTFSTILKTMYDQTK